MSARLFAIGWLFHLKTLTTSLFFVLVSVLQPVIFASIAFFMVESGNQAGTLLYVALGAGLMGIWSATLFGSGGAIQWQRWQGTLELMVGAPPPLVAILLPLTVATATIGIYSVVATLAWGRLFFGMPLDFAHPFQLALALPTTILSLGMLGLLLASTFVLYRQANAFSNLLEYPVWLATGLLVPLSLLPGWVTPISWILSPTWGMRAVREAAFGGDAWPEMAVCAALGARVPRPRRTCASELRAAGPQPGDSVPHVSASARVFFVGGAISYRALFNWIQPGMYVATMLGSPLFQILFFTYLGRYAGSEDDAFFIVGNAIQVAAMAGIYGMTMGIANERQFGTLQQLLATPANRLAIFSGRALPFIANGLVVSAFGFAVSWLLLDFRPAAGSVPPLAFAVLVTTCSCVALGMLIGSIGLRARDVFFGANLVYFLMLLVCGVNVPNDDLPGWLAAIGRCLPLTHGIEAAREIAAGAGLGDVASLLWTEAFIGLAYATVAFGLFRLFETEGRRRASLEAY